jgi:hypothetical protein
MSLNKVAEAGSRRYKHGVNVHFAEEWRWCVDRRWDMDSCGLAKLAFMTSSDVPFHVTFECWPPNMVKEGAVCGVEPFMAEIFMRVTYQGCALLGLNV